MAALPRVLYFRNLVDVDIVKIVSDLLKLGADPNKEDRVLGSSLCTIIDSFLAKKVKASKKVDERELELVVSALLKAGANPNNEYGLYKDFTKYNFDVWYNKPIKYREKLTAMDLAEYLPDGIREKILDLLIEHGGVKSTMFSRFKKNFGL